MATINLNIRVDKEIKAKADAIFAELGLNTSAAINVMLRQCVRYGGIPFELRVDVPNADTLSAMNEATEIRNNPSNYQGYSDVDQMFKDILADEEI